MLCKTSSNVEAQAGGKMSMHLRCAWVLLLEMGDLLQDYNF